MARRSRDGRSPLLIGLLLLYAAASLLHFVHNAEYLADYPNLPDWLTRSRVYFAWLGVAAIGAVGYVLHRRDHALGLVLLGVYAALGLDGLLHYGRAPLAAHTAAMNFTIGFEVAAAALLLVAVLVLAGRRFRHG
jgi:hypothetical protein